MKIEVGKTYAYSNKGTKAKCLLKLDCAPDRWPGHFFVLQCEHTGDVYLFKEDGTSSSGGYLLPNKVKKEGWINIYSRKKLPKEERIAGVGGAFASKSDADRVATGDRVACVKIEWEEEE